MFEKNSTGFNYESRKTKIENKILELQSEVDQKNRSINERKENLQGYLGEFSLFPDKPGLEEKIHNCKKSLERITESRDDLIQSIEFLKKEMLVLEKENFQRIVETSPARLEEIGGEFNKLLDQALDTMTVLKSLFSDLKGKERNFHSLMDERQKCLNKLGQVSGLNLKEGLGRLAFVGSPFAFSLQLPGEFTGQFLDVLKVYQEKVKGYEDFKNANPDFQTKIDQINQRDKEEEQNTFSFLTRTLKGWAK
jgi:hypothetical protein